MAALYEPLCQLFEQATAELLAHAPRGWGMGQAEAEATLIASMVFGVSIVIVLVWNVVSGLTFGVQTLLARTRTTRFHSRLRKDPWSRLSRAQQLEAMHFEQVGPKLWRRDAWCGGPADEMPTELYWDPGLRQFGIRIPADHLPQAFLDSPEGPCWFQRDGFERCHFHSEDTPLLNARDPLAVASAWLSYASSVLDGQPSSKLRRTA